MASISGLRIQHCHELWCRSQTRLRSHIAVAQCIGIVMSCGIGRRLYLDLALLWLWHRLLAAAPVWPLARELPYAAGATLKRHKNCKWKALLPDLEKSNLRDWVSFAAGEAEGSRRGPGLHHWPSAPHSASHLLWGLCLCCSAVHRTLLHPNSASLCSPSIATLDCQPGSRQTDGTPNAGACENLASPGAA